MEKQSFLLKPFKCLTLSLFAAGCIFASSTQAFIATEVHVCATDSQTGGWWAGSYYWPGARTARTYLYEATAEPTTLTVMLWAYPEGGTNYTYHEATDTVDAGWFFGYAAASEDSTPAPGALLSYHLATTPTMTRASKGYYIPQGAPAGSTGCASQVDYF